MTRPDRLLKLRRTGLLEDGVNIRVVQDLMGHADVKTTEIYTHVMDKDLSVAFSPWIPCKIYDSANVFVANRVSVGCAGWCTLVRDWRIVAQMHKMVKHEFTAPVLPPLLKGSERKAP